MWPLRSTFFLLATALMAAIGAAKGRTHPQAILSSPPSSPSVEPSENPSKTDGLQDADSALFSSVHGFLKSSTPSLNPYGWSITPGYIPAGTLLYHGSGTGLAPSSGMEWLAFDQEHAFYFGFGYPPHAAALITFAATRPLPIIYFDGESSGKHVHGAQDLQNLILFGNDTDQWRDEFPDERPRSQKLCEWAVRHGYGGIVRLEYAFELIWCDFGKDLEKVRQVNMHPPLESVHPDLADLDRHRDGDDAQLHLTLEDGSGEPQSIYLRAANWNFLNAGAAHYHTRDPRVILSVRDTTSLHNPKYTSLRKLYNISSYCRRLLNVSGEDAFTFQEEVSRGLTLWHQRRTLPTGLDHDKIIEGIVQRKVLEFRQKHYWLSHFNATEAVLQIKMMAYRSLVSYFNGSEILGFDADPRKVASRQQALQKLARDCATAYAPRSSSESITTQEKRLDAAIEVVHGRLCAFDVMNLGDAIEWESRHGSTELIDGSRLLSKWSAEFQVLKSWLRWPALLTCQTECQANEICFYPVWPFAPDGDWRPFEAYYTEFAPRCLSWDKERRNVYLPAH